MDTKDTGQKVYRLFFWNDQKPHNRLNFFLKYTGSLHNANSLSAKLEFKLEKIIWIYKHAGKVRKTFCFKNCSDVSLFTVSISKSFSWSLLRTIFSHSRSGNKIPCFQNYLLETWCRLVFWLRGFKFLLLANFLILLNYAKFQSDKTNLIFY